MVCIYCGAETSVVNSRPQKRLNKVWRRRNCSSCRAIFTSIESPALTESLMIADNSSKHTLRPFLRDKLLMSIYSSCRHRQESISDATALTDTVLSHLPAISQEAVVNRLELIKTVESVLKRFDTAAAVHYSAFHKS